MKLRRLEIEHFGIFSGYRIEFAGDGMQVIFGPNEAGKSTLLQLVREILFGFSLRNPYAFEEHAGEMAATGLIELSDGSRVRFRRRKGRSKEVVGEHLVTGQPIDGSGLARLLGGASGELFQHVFGFSLAELAAGEQSLRDARLSEALYGGALGGLTSFQNISRDLEKDHEQLFSPAATKRPINQLLSELKRLGKELRAAQVRPRDYELLAREVGRLDQRVADLRQQRDDLQRQTARTTKLIQAIRLWQQRRQLEEEIAALQVPPGFPRDGGEQYASLTTQRDQIAGELDDFRHEFEEISGQLSKLSPNAELIARAAEIQRLAQQLDMIRGFRRDIGMRQQESNMVKDRVATRLRDLDPEWTLEQMDRFRTSLARRTAVETMQTELDQLDARSRELLARRPELVTDIATMNQRLEELSDQLVPASLADVVDAAPSYDARRQKMRELQAQIQETRGRVAALETRLNAPFSHQLTDIRNLPVPLAQPVSEFRQRWLEATRQLDRCGQNLEQANADCERCRDELAAVHAKDDVPNRDQLAAARGRRDRGWRLVRRGYIDQLPVAGEDIDEWLAGDSGPLPDAYETAVRDADRVADQRQRQAEVVARQDQLADERARLEQRLARAGQTRDAAAGRVDACRQDWQAMWEPAGIEPASPDAMLEWLRLYEEFVDQCAACQVTEAQMEMQQAAIAEYEAELKRAVRDGPASPSGLLSEARRRLKRAQEAVSERKSYETQLPRKKHQLATLDNELAELQRRREAWTGRWVPLMTQFGFPAAWDVHTTTKVLIGLSEARAEHDQAEALDRRIADMRNGLETFDRDVQLLCRDLAHALLDLPAEHALEELGRRLDQAKQQERDQRSLTESKRKLDVRCGTKAQQLQRLEDLLRQLANAAGVEGQDEISEVARRVRLRYDLCEKVDAIDHQLRAIRGSEDPVSFEAALGAADTANLESRQRMLELEFEKIDGEFNSVLQERGVAAEKLRTLDSASQAATTAQDMESARSQLRDAVERWVPLVLARAFMQRALQQFEKEHQPQMLVEVGRLFHRMTVGRYTELTRRLDERGTLLVRQADGRLKEPQQLSTGTREQLYLAIRLAYVLRYCREAEPLPVVMDDVLVNFDDRRAARTLDTLIEIAQQVQLILLTCHQSTLDMVRSRLPDLQPIQLEEAQ